MSILEVAVLRAENGELKERLAEALRQLGLTSANLGAEIERLRAALKPFAAIRLWRDAYPDGPEMLMDEDGVARGCVCAADVRTAREALALEQKASD